MDRLQQRFRERTRRAVRRGGVGGRVRGNTRRTEAVVRRNPAFQAAGLTRGRGVAGDSRGVLGERRFLIALEFLGFQRDLVGDFILAARIRDSLFRARNQEDFAADLGAVADADGRGDGGKRRYVVTVELRVVRGGREGVGLPFAGLLP